MPEIGTVISTPEGPSSSNFSFVLNTKEPVRKGQYIQIETNEGILIARVGEIFKSNKYYSQAETVKEYEKDGRKMNDIFPAENWEYLVANAIPLGIFSEGMQQRISFPPSPGQKVFSADANILSDFLGLDKNGIDIGKLAFHDVNVKLNITKLFQKHAAILAISGAGKSYLSAVLIEELLENSQPPAIIVFDPHGEYSGFANDEKFVGKIKVFDKNNISISANKLTASMLSELITELSPVQRRELNNLLRELKEKNPGFNFEDLMKYVEESEMNPKTQETLLSWLADISLSRLFSAVDSPSIEELARAGQMSVFDLSDFVSLRDRQIILTTFARKLFNARREKKIPPFILFVEEAHQFCPQDVERSLSISRSIIEQIAREGRKFNSCLVLISQRPINLSTTALSQCNTHIILRVTNPYDLDHIQKSSEGLTSDVINTIPGLKVGEAYVVGEAVNYPILMKIRNRKSKKSEKGKKLEDELQEFSAQISSRKEDVKAFL